MIEIANILKVVICIKESVQYAGLMFLSYNVHKLFSQTKIRDEYDIDMKSREENLDGVKVHLSQIRH